MRYQAPADERLKQALGLESLDQVLRYLEIFVKEKPQVPQILVVYGQLLKVSGIRSG